MTVFALKEIAPLPISVLFSDVVEKVNELARVVNKLAVQVAHLERGLARLG